MIFYFRAQSSILGNLRSICRIKSESTKKIAARTRPSVSEVIKHELQPLQHEWQIFLLVIEELADP